MPSALERRRATGPSGKKKLASMTSKGFCACRRRTSGRMARVMARLSATGFTKMNLITDTAPEA